MARLYTVHRLKIGHTAQMDALARAAGDLYSQVVVWFWRTVRRKDLWLKAKHLLRWLTSALLHAHSSDATSGRCAMTCGMVRENPRPTRVHEPGRDSRSRGCEPQPVCRHGSGACREPYP